MCKILFRGKRVDNGEWVEGDLIHSLGRTYCGIYAETLAQVDPATVGQFTGLHDGTKWDGLTDSEKLDFYHQHYVGEDGMSVRFQKIDDVKYLWNGKRIFEGDIVFIPRLDKAYEVKYQFGQFYVGINQPIAYERNCCEIIGNIHDNPELIENRKGDAGE